MNVPCNADIVTFQELSSTPYSVFVGENVTVKEIRLPLNMRINLGKEVAMRFSNDTNCATRAGAQNQFVGGRRRDWFNPNNWMTTGDGSSSTLDSDLALNRIPCENDNVVFPSEAAFSVFIGRPVTVRSVNFQGSSFTNDALQDFLQSDSGLLQFQLVPQSGSNAVASSLTVTGQDCRDPGGCSCGNNMDDPDFTQEKCRTFVLSSCPAISTLPCSYPFRPPRACCFGCGSAVQVTVKAENQQNFLLHEFETLVLNTLDSYNASGGVSRVQNDDGSLSYVIFYIVESQSTAELIGQSFTDKFSGTNQGELGLPANQIIFQSDDEPLAIHGDPGVVPPTEQSSSSSKTVLYAGAAAGAVIVILLIFIIFLVCYKCRLKKSLHLRFDDDYDPSSMGATFTNGSDDPKATVTGFSNPIYSDSGMVKENPMFGVKQNDLEMANPVYSEIGDLQ